MQPRCCPRFRHSGNAGDIIYALPSICGLETDLPKHLNLRIGECGYYRDNHPLGNVMLNEEMALRLLPLLQSQPYLECVTLDGTEPIDYDLDLI